MTKIKVLDLFSGAGGMSLGFQNAGFQIFGCVEFDSTIVKTHHKNFPDSININKDIRDISNDEVIDYFGEQIDIIIGGPPCQGFSIANKWQSEEEKIEKNRLFFEFLRFVRILRPKVFVIENVKEIFTKDNGYAKDQITQITEEYGYNVESSVLNASYYGVPQNRKRAFFVGIRNDIGVRFNFSNLETKKKVTVYEAISDLYCLENGNCENPDNFEHSEFQLRMINPTKEIFNHDIKYPNEGVQERMSHVKQGGNWKDVPSNLWTSQRNNRHSSAYRRLHEMNPSITIDTGHMNYFHPIYNRVPTVRESARIQSFPDSFIFEGTRTSQYTQVGNAVPPLLAEAIANEILRLLMED